MTTDSSPSDTSGEGSACFSRTEQLAEVSVFLFLIVPSMALSFLAVQQGGLSFAFVAISIILRDLALVSLILFFLWRNGEHVTAIGWTFRNRGKEIGVGLFLFIPVFAGAAALELALQVLGLSTPSKPLPSFLAPTGMGEMGLALALVAVVAVAEETIFRGYLLLRLKAVTRSTAMATVLSAGIFALGHGYEGPAGVATVGVMGFVLALIYLWRRSLLAPVVIHFLQDFVSIILLPFVLVR